MPSYVADDEVHIVDAQLGVSWSDRVTDDDTLKLNVNTIK